MTVLHDGSHELVGGLEDRQQWLSSPAQSRSSE